MKLIRPMAITDAVMVGSSVPENDHPPWMAGVSYPLGDKVMLTSTHKRYESLTAGNVNRNPAADPAAWLELGATNRWRLFDASVGSQTTGAGSIEVTLQAVGRVDAIAALNVNAQSVRVVMTDAIDGVVYDRTFGMVSASGITNMHAWYFEPIVRKRDLVVLNLPPYANATLSLTFAEAGGSAACGVLVLGQAKDIGGTRWGASVGITDYSKKERNPFGDYIVVERAFAKRGRFNLQLASSQVDDVQNLLAQYRATPIVYVGAEQYGATVMYGFYKDFDIVIPSAVFSECSIEIEGLT